MFCMCYTMLWWFFVVGDVVSWSKVEYSVREVLAIKFFDVKANKTVVFFVFNGLKPLDHRCRVSPLVELGCSRDFSVDSVMDYFADSANSGIWWVWLVGRSVCERSSVCGPSVLWMIQYPRVYVNCEDELHTLPGVSYLEALCQSGLAHSIVN